MIVAPTPPSAALLASATVAPGMPWNDWQFWLVTVLALLALAAIVRPLLPSRGKAAACPGCGPGQASPPPTELTVDGRRVR